MMFGIFQTYNYIFHELRDPRSKDLWHSGPGLTLAIITTYLIFCAKLGPWLMEHRKPFELKNVIFVYNVLQVSMSIFLFKLGSSFILFDEFNWRCETMDFSNSPKALRAVSACWLLFFAKLTELIETVFFVLRKKNKQVSFLHLYHHTLMVWTTWVGAYYFPGGQPIFLCTINALVHINMYSYYLISGVAQNNQKYVLWKKLTTASQIESMSSSGFLFAFVDDDIEQGGETFLKIQFVAIFIHCMYGICTGCPYPKALSWVVTSNCLFFMYLFGRFYYSNYVKSSYKNGVVKND